MDLRYEVYLHIELIEAVPKRGNQREKVMRFIRTLANDPFQAGDFTDKDTSAQPRQIKIIGDYAVTCWADHPVKAVMVVDIHLTDR